MKTIIALVSGLAASLALAGCQGIPIPLPIPGASPDITSIEKQVIAECQAFCGFLPLASDIGAVLASGNPALQTAEAISKAVCSAIAVTPQHRGVRVRSAVMVGGVVVHLIPAR